MGLFDYLYTERDETSTHNIVTTTLLNTNTLDIKSLTDFVAFDIETTGLRANMDSIIELAAIRFSNGIITQRYSSLIKVQTFIPAHITRINNITNEMLATAPTEIAVYKELIRQFLDALNGETIMCAHNAKFDFSFLENTLKRLGFSANIRFIDTMAIAKKYLPHLPDFRQDTVANFFDIYNSNAHRAEADAEVCGKMLAAIVRNCR